MQNVFVKKVGQERLKNEDGDQYGTVHLVAHCKEDDPDAIQISPIDCVPSVLWGFGKIHRDVWDQHQYRIVDAAQPSRSIQTNVDFKSTTFWWEKVENVGDCIRLSTGELLTPRGIANEGGEWWHGETSEIGFFE